jgi:isochorismate synthase
VIDSGEIDKVVLARSVIVRSDGPPAILRMFRELVVSYPQCYNFAWKSGDAVFMGASPELLASVDGSNLRSNPLAGSAPRGEGKSDDREIGSRLLGSSKDRREHALVIESMTEQLSPLTRELSVSDVPSLKKMATVQHLSTEITGVLEPGVGLFDVIEAVHPTPAVGGVPTKAAVDLIAQLESIDRGWYTGGIGWVDGAGDGAVALGLRCGLIRGNTTHLFAGAGIVSGSQPDDELRETRLKLRPLLQLLTAT